MFRVPLQTLGVKCFIQNQNRAGVQKFVTVLLLRTFSVSFRTVNVFASAAKTGPKERDKNDSKAYVVQLLQKAGSLFVKRWHAYALC